MFNSKNYLQITVSKRATNILMKYHIFWLRGPLLMMPLHVLTYIVLSSIDIRRSPQLSVACAY